MNVGDLHLKIVNDLEDQLVGEGGRLGTLVGTGPLFLVLAGDLLGEGVDLLLAALDDAGVANDPLGLRLVGQHDVKAAEGHLDLARG